MRPSPGKGSAGALAALALLLVCSSVPGQDAAVVERSAAVVIPDTVRVGEVFALGITAASPDSLGFPAVLTLNDALEQTGPPATERDSTGVWRTVYPLVAWKAGRIPIPAVNVAVVGGTEERALLVHPPPVDVRTVLPPAASEPRLQPPRAPSESRRVPWAWILALALVAWLTHRLLRSNRAAVHASPPDEPVVSALEEARTALEALRARAVSEGESAAALYDGIESVLRRYLGRTRAWPEQSPVRDAVREVLPDREVDLEPVVRRAMPARFGALDVSRQILVEDLDAVLAWLETEDAA